MDVSIIETSGLGDRTWASSTPKRPALVDLALPEPADPVELRRRI